MGWPSGELNVHQSSTLLTEARRATDVWLMGVLSEGVAGFVGPSLSRPTTPIMLGLAVPYVNLGTDWATALDTIVVAATASAASWTLENIILGLLIRRRAGGTMKEAQTVRALRGKECATMEVAT